jgi:hypothetical protein
LILLTGAGILLLIESVNVTTSPLARSDKRRREIAVREAIGASASRLFRQFATEAFVLASAACILAWRSVSFNTRTVIDPGNLAVRSLQRFDEHPCIVVRQILHPELPLLHLSVHRHNQAQQ